MHQLIEFRYLIICTREMLLCCGKCNSAGGGKPRLAVFSASNFQSFTPLPDVRYTVSFLRHPVYHPTTVRTGHYGGYY
jgi:hypothetical protein